MAPKLSVTVTGNGHKLLCVHNVGGGKLGAVVANGEKAASAFFFERNGSGWRVVPVQLLGQPPYQLPVALRNYVRRERNQEVLYPLTEEDQLQVLASAQILIDGHLVTA